MAENLETRRSVFANSLASLDSTAQTGHGGDWQEVVFQKIKSMKDMYLGELNDMHQKITAKLQRHESIQQQSRSKQFDKLKVFKAMLERLIAFLSVSSKENITRIHKEKLGRYEKQIVNFLTSSRPRNPAQQGQLPLPHMQAILQPQSQLSQVQSHDNQMNPQLQPVNMQGSMQTLQQNNLSSLQHNSVMSLPGVSLSQQSMLSSLQPSSNTDLGQGNALTKSMQESLASTAQTGHDGDWQEEIFQKIKSTKDMYLGELNDMHQKITAKLQWHEFIQQRSRSEQFDKLKIFEAMLERLIAFLSVSSKENITLIHNEKLGRYEKQIVNFLTSNRPRNSAQQGQLPLPHMQAIPQPESQLSQVQSHENQMNPQLQPVNMQRSMQTMQQNNLSNLQHNSVMCLPGVSLAQQSVLSSLRPSSNMDLGQGNALRKSMQASLDSTAQTGYGGDWQEEVFQKIKSMKDMYLDELNAMLQKITEKVQQHESIQQQSRLEQLEKCKILKAMLERLIAFLSVSSKENIAPIDKEKLGFYEMQIVNFITSNLHRRPAQL